MCRLTDHQCIGRSQALDSGGDVGGFSEGQLFVTPCSAHSPDHHQSSVDTKPYIELKPWFSLQTDTQIFHRREDTQPSTNGPLRIIFVCHGIAKIDEEAIP